MEQPEGQEAVDPRTKVKPFRLNNTLYEGILKKYPADSQEVQLIEMIKRAEVSFEALSLLFGIDEKVLTRNIYGTAVVAEEDKDTIYRKIPLILNEALALDLLPCSDKRAIIPILQTSVRIILQAKRLEALSK